MVDETFLRLVQTFLPRRGYGVYLVSMCMLTDLLICDCPGFGVRGKCKHTRYVEDRLIEQDGSLLIEVPEGDYTDDVRELVLKYVTPVVLG